MAQLRCESGICVGGFIIDEAADATSPPLDGKSRVQPEQFRLGMHYSLRNNAPTAARQLVFIGEQNNVRTQLEPGEQTITSNARGRGYRSPSNSISMDSSRKNCRLLQRALSQRIGRSARYGCCSVEDSRRTEVEPELISGTSASRPSSAPDPQ